MLAKTEQLSPLAREQADRAVQAAIAASRAVSTFKASLGCPPQPLPLTMLGGTYRSAGSGPASRDWGDDPTDRTKSYTNAGSPALLAWVEDAVHGSALPRRLRVSAGPARPAHPVGRPVAGVLRLGQSAGSRANRGHRPARAGACARAESLAHVGSRASCSNWRSPGAGPTESATGLIHPCAAPVRSTRAQHAAPAVGVVVTAGSAIHVEAGGRVGDAQNGHGSVAITPACTCSR
jgi:hypothetical protein